MTGVTLTMQEPRAKGREEEMKGPDDHRYFGERVTREATKLVIMYIYVTRL